MTRKGKFILAGVVTATVGLAAAGAIAQRGPWDGHKGHHFGHRGGAGILGLGFGAPQGRFCRGDGAEMADIMLVRLEHRINPTDDQKAAFDEFKAATRTATETLREGCPKKPEPTADGKMPAQSPVERLAQVQVGLEASLEALKSYRPAAEKFYATLTDEQKSKLERRGKREWKRERGERGERGGERGWHGKPDREPQQQEEGPAPDDKG